jgi:hypothetical protein
MRKEGSDGIPGAADCAETTLKAKVELSPARILQCVFRFFEGSYDFH